MDGSVAAEVRVMSSVAGAPLALAAIIKLRTLATFKTESLSPLLSIPQPVNIVTILSLNRLQITK